jgi:hypothetical protein
MLILYKVCTANAPLPAFGNYFSHGPIEYYNWCMNGILGTQECRLTDENCPCSVCKPPDLTKIYKLVLEGDGEKGIPSFARVMAYEDIMGALENPEEFPGILSDPFFASAAEKIEHHKVTKLQLWTHPAYVQCWDKIYEHPGDMPIRYGVLTEDDDDEDAQIGKRL